jgi:hypothetical protein
MMNSTQLEEVDIVLIDEEVLAEVEQWVSGCQHCADNAATPLDYVLDAVTGCDPTVSTYLMRRPVRCQTCSGWLTEKTLVAV